MGRFALTLGVYAALAIAAGTRLGAAQAPPAASPTPPADSTAPMDSTAGPDYYDITGDYTSLKKIDGETVLELSQNVRIVHGDVTVTADRAVSFTARHITQLFGHVRVQQKTMVMTGEEGEYRQYEDLATLQRKVRIVDQGWNVDCDEVRYSRRTGEAWLTGHVVGRDSTSTLRTDRLLYQRETGRAEAFDSVELTNSTQRIVVRGTHGVYYRDRHEGVIDREPRLVSGPDDEEPVTVVSDTMRVYPDSSRATAYYRVKIIKGNTVTQCDSAMLYDDRHRVELYGNPLARQDNTSMKGDRMIAYYNEEEINRIDIMGSAGIDDAQRDSLVVGRNSWVKGDTISLYLHDNDLDSLRVIGDASSEYYPSTPNKVEGNFIRGHQMFFRFGHDQIEHVDVAGKAEGTYRYVNLGSKETADSLRAASDSTLKYVSFEKKAERVVYSAEHIQYLAGPRDLVLTKGARLKYHESELTGESITYHSALQILDATGSPTLTDAGQKLYGTRMDYDLDKETGLVTSGSTQYEQGYYTGENLARVGENELKVWNSWYTTCDLKEPHYHFAARNMKVFSDDKIFTGPIWLYVGKTPLFALPFLANSISHGRRSGFLRPDFEFGVSGDKGRFIRNVGYYWATNDYLDFMFVGDFNEDRSWLLHVNNNYALRYRFNGDANFSYFRNMVDQSTEWTLDGRHRQTLGERASLNADLHFVSSDAATKSVTTIDDVNRYIDRRIRSNVSLRKAWDTSTLSASASRAQTLNIVDPNAEKVTMTLPDVTYSVQAPTFHGIRLTPTLSASRRTVEKLFENSETITGGTGLSFSRNQRVKFVNITPSAGVDFRYSRFDLQRRAHTEIVTSGVVPDTIAVAALDSLLSDAQFNWNVGTSAGANFYGTFYPHIGRLRGIRHTISPTASYRFTPSQDGRPRVQSVGLSLRNALDLKVLDTSKRASAEADTAASPTETMHKLDGVVLWNLSTSYRPDVPLDKAWGTIGSTVNLALRVVNLSLNHLIDPYSFDVTNTSATSNLRIAGTHPFGRTSNVEVRELNAVAASDTTKKKTADFATGGSEFAPAPSSGARPGDELELEKGRLPWSMTLGLSYSKSQNGPASSTLRVGWDLSLSDNWRINYSTIYDVEARELSGQNFGITRDLHCWEMTFSRQLLGDEWQYYFRISLKAHPDLYGENGNRGLRAGGFINQF